MFFVTLLFSAIETWMRTQSGASGLRAVIYLTRSPATCRRSTTRLQK